MSMTENWTQIRMTICELHPPECRSRAGMTIKNQ